MAEADGNPLALLELPATADGDPGPLPLPHRLQDAYQRRIAELPAPARNALLVAAAEESGALADALAGDPDRAAWHRAAAATGPDEEVAADLEAAALRARRRSGPATAVAALERAARLTSEEAERARRLALAAEIAVDAGLPDRARHLAGQALRLTGDARALARIATEISSLRSRSRARARWVAGHLLFALAGSVLILIAAGLTMGLVAGAPGKALAGALVQVPATWVLAGAGVLAFGLLPRAAAAISWAAFLFVNLFGEVLGPILGIDQAQGVQLSRARRS